MQFLALRKKQLRLVLEPRVFKAQAGRVITEGMYGEFPNGKTVEFNEGVFNTEDPKVIAAIKSHPHYGVDFVSTDPNEGAVLPTDAAVAEINEKKTLAEEVSSTCPECGKAFKNSSQLNGHMLSHRK